MSLLCGLLRDPKRDNSSALDAEVGKRKSTHSQCELDLETLVSSVSEKSDNPSESMIICSIKVVELLLQKMIASGGNKLPDFEVLLKMLNEVGYRTSCATGTCSHPKITYSIPKNIDKGQFFDPYESLQNSLAQALINVQVNRRRSQPRRTEIKVTSNLHFFPNTLTPQDLKLHSLFPSVPTPEVLYHKAVVVETRAAGNFLATLNGGNNPALKIWKFPRTRNEKEELIFQNRFTLMESPSALLYLNNEQTLLVGLKGGRINAFKIHASEDGLECMEFLGSFKSSKPNSAVTSIIDLQDGRRIATLDIQEGMVKIWSLASFSCVDTLKFQDQNIVKCVAVPSENGILTATDSGNLGFWRRKANGYTCVKIKKAHEETIVELSHFIDPVNAKGKGFVLTSGTDSLVKIWDMKRFQCVRTIKLKKFANMANFLPNWRQLMLQSVSKTLYMVNYRTGRATNSIRLKSMLRDWTYSAEENLIFITYGGSAINVLEPM